jgi:AcrR family transcriptional regulator
VIDTMNDFSAISDSHHRLLDAAEALFHERGYRAVTMQDIARELGIRQASLYYHVPDGKEQLFVEVIRRNFEQQRLGLEAALLRAGDDLESQLRAAGAWFASQPPMNLLGMMHADMPALSEANHSKLNRLAAYCLFEPLAAVFAEAIARDEIRPLPPDLLAGSFLALMDGVSYSGQHQPGTPPRFVMVEAIISLILDGLRPRAALQESTR